LHPSGVANSSTSFGWGKGWNVTSAGWQVSSSSGVATSVTELLYPCYLTLLYFKWIYAPSNKNAEIYLVDLTRG